MVSAITEPDRHHRLVETAFAISTETLRNACPVLQLSEVCPYRGLAAFTEADTEFFFGRQQIVDGLLNRLRRDPRFLTVLGPSGSGKSSVVRAGLIPQLRSGKVPGSERWGVIVTRPAAQPFDELTKQGVVDGSHDLTENVRVWLSQHVEQERLMLVIDQFEELLSICPEAVRQDFITQLVKLLQSPLSIAVVLVMRDDFYSRLSQQAALVEWLERSGGPLHVPRFLKQGELIAIVQKPIEAVGLRFEEGLVETIVKDTLETSGEAEESGQVGRSAVLPLLEFALTELWERRQGGMLTHEAYHSIGGVAGALTQWADRTFYTLKPDKRRLAQRILTDLVYIGDKSQGIFNSRRRRTLISLPRNNSEQESVQQVVQHLVKNRLLVTDRDLQSNEETVEIIHDALLREWGQLQEWLDKDRGFLTWHQGLERLVHVWVVQRDKNKLLRGRDLTEAEEWLKKRGADLSQDTVAFIRASASQRILRLVSIIVVVLLLVSSLGITGWFVFFQPSKTLVTTLQESGVGSLSWCINNAPSGSTISFAQGVRGIINLRGGGLAFEGGKRLTIAGPGANQLTISGGNLNAKIHVPEGAMLNISGLSFKKSETDFDAFLINDGTLTLINSIVSDNKTIASLNGFGGGIHNTRTGTLTMINSTISNNSSTALLTAKGGGITNDGTLTLINSTIAGNSIRPSLFGSGEGGGIDNGGKLTVTHSTFSNNSALGSITALGGGIFNQPGGTLIVTDSTFSGNSASGEQVGKGGGIVGSGAGGGIDNGGRLTVTQSTFSNNSAHFGGGINNHWTSTLIVTDSTFSGNSASGKQGAQGGCTIGSCERPSSVGSGEGGGIDNGGKLTVTHSTFSNNSALSSNKAFFAFGGGIDNLQTGTLIVTDSTFSGNSASGKQSAQGGGIDNAGKLTMTHSTFSGNSASSKQSAQGGGIDNEGKLTVTQSTFSNNSANSSNFNAFGGGIDNLRTGTLNVTDSTFSGNSVSGKQYSEGGGIDNEGKLTVTQSTFSNNSALSSSSNNGLGGGILSHAAKGASAIIRFCTIYGNTSSTGGGIWVDPTGSSQMTISGSVIAANSAHDGPDISGALISNGYNLIKSVAGATGLNVTTDKQVTLTELGISPTLGNNGGPTQTLALLQGSKAIDAVPLQACSITITDIFGLNVRITTDQRGMKRPDENENRCDIGAYEFSP